MSLYEVARSALIASLISTSVSVFAAADPGVGTAVEAVPPAVTLSRPSATIPLETFAAYKFTVGNSAASALNRVFLDGTATVTGGGTAIAAYDSFESTDPGVTCVVGTAANKVHCDLPSLAPGTTSAVVIVVFRAPSVGTAIEFNSNSGGFEGNGGGNGCCSQLIKTTTALVDSTSTTFQTAAKSYVRQLQGGTVFTGNEAVTTQADGWSTFVTVPGGFAADPSLGANYTVASIAEGSSADATPPSPPLACPAYSKASTCFSSDLSIPGTFGALKITLRLDKAYFDSKVNPALLSLKYTGASTHDWVSYPHTLKLCSDDNALQASYPNQLTGLAPYPGRPCLSSVPFIYSNGYTIRDLRGDLEFRVWASDNGRYTQ